MADINRRQERAYDRQISAMRVNTSIWSSLANFRLARYSTR